MANVSSLLIRQHIDHVLPRTDPKDGVYSMGGKTLLDYLVYKALQHDCAFRTDTG